MTTDALAGQTAEAASVEAASVEAATAEAATAPAAGSPWLTALRQGAGYWAVAMAGYLTITVGLALSDANKNAHVTFTSWVQWDSFWYIDIAQHGYASDSITNATASYAFYPLFPSLTWAMNLVTPGNTVFAAFLVSILSFLAFLVVFYRFLDRELTDKALVNRTMWYLLLLPTTFLLAAPYPMSVFLALTVASIYCMRHGHWWAAGLWGAFATSSRLSAMLLGVFFVLEYLRQRDWSVRRVRFDALWVGLIPVGLLIYLGYTASRGDALAPFHAQDYWGHVMSLPWTGWLTLADTVLVKHDFVLYYVLDLTVVALFAAALVALARLGNNRWLDRLYLVIALPLQVILLITHLHGGWVG